MSLALLFHCLLLDMFRMLVHPSSGACDLLWIYFMCCIARTRACFVDPLGSATSSQGIPRRHISLMASFNGTYFLIREKMFR